MSQPPSPSARPIVCPELGSDAGRVTVWLAEVGEEVTAGDRVVEVLLPGLSLDVSAGAGGLLSRIDRRNHQPVASGDVLGWIEPFAAEDGA
ncbi:MAG: biotin/lipoyl-containing protein [Planctomycetota bacterium]